MMTNGAARGVLGSITLRQLQYFIAVAEEEHFTRAAERLVIAQPALSRQVSELEELLEVELLVRSSRGVRLTEAGRELLERSRALFDGLERTIEAVQSAGSGGQGRLRLGYYGPAFFYNDVTRTALERFRAEAPHVEVIAHELMAAQFAAALRSGKIDLAISRGTQRGSDIAGIVIGNERLVLMIAEDDPLARQTHVSLRDIDGRGLILFPNSLAGGYNDRVHAVLREAGVTTSIAREITQHSSIGYHVARGEGISIMPISSARLPFPGMAVREFSDAFATIDLIAFMRRGDEAPALQHFLRLLTA